MKYVISVYDITENDDHKSGLCRVEGSKLESNSPWDTIIIDSETQHEVNYYLYIDWSPYEIGRGTDERTRKNIHCEIMKIFDKHVVLDSDVLVYTLTEEEMALMLLHFS